MKLTRAAIAPLFLGIAIMPLMAHAQAIGWRGDSSGKFPAATPPTEWNETPPKNLAWVATIGTGYSTPVVSGNRVFLTAEPNHLLCLDRESGKILWDRSNGFADLPLELRGKDQKLATSCGYATPTPTTDGKLIYAFFGTGIVACYDVEGNRKWIVFLEMEANSPYGRSASPVLVGDKLVIPISAMMALDAATGKVAWKQDKADATYGSPIVATVGKLNVLLTPDGDILRISDGKLLAKDQGPITYTAPIYQDGVAYYIDAQSYALQLSPKGDDDIEITHLWDASVDGSEFFASPVLHDGLIYVIDKEAVYSVLEAKTGKTVLHQVLTDLPPGGKGTDDGPSVWPSVTMAGKYLYLSNNKGDTLVVEPGLEYKQIHHNRLSDGSPASPAFDGKQMFFRGAAKLYCIEQK